MIQDVEQSQTPLLRPEAESRAPEAFPSDESPPRKLLVTRRAVLMVPFSFLAGMGAGYLLWTQAPGLFPAIGQYAGTNKEVNTIPTVINASTVVNLPESYTLPVVLGDIGSRLIEAGVIDRSRFIETYAAAGKPLTDAQLAILDQSHSETVVIDQANSYFLLNLFWAFGLVNQNPILTEGAMVTKSDGRIENFASTGGWTLAIKPITELYASIPLVPLSADRQARMNEVANAVHRPCCNNSTAFPDCNHGMAMLGLLELMAAQDATVDDMREAAKFVNAFWFPQQMAEIATLLKVTEGIDYANAEARLVVSANYSSSSGFQAIHRWLVDNGHLSQPASGGNQCGV